MYKIFVALTIVCVILAAPNKYFLNSGSKITTNGNVDIVGGNTTHITKHPWQVSVQHQYEHFCGGFLVSPTWVVTAAHCLTQGFNTSLNVRAGSIQKGSGGETAVVNGYVVHPKYSDHTMDNDIALLRLASAITNRAARAATLPTAGASVNIGSTLYVTGWGATIEKGRGVENLQEVTVPTVDRDYCNKANSNIAVTENMFCAGYTAGGRDACQEDSGGPASVNGVVVGVVSWGNGCARANFLGVYTNVANYRGWIARYAHV